MQFYLPLTPQVELLTRTALNRTLLILQTADVGMTETSGENGLRFEIWFRRRTSKNQTYILQAGTIEIKQAWTSDIARILWQQATRNKGDLQRRGSPVSPDNPQPQLPTKPCFIQTLSPPLLQAKQERVGGCVLFESHKDWFTLSLQLCVKS